MPRHKAHREQIVSEDESDLFDLVASVSPKPAPADGMVVGRLAGLDGAGRPLVDFPGNPAREECTARSTVALEPAHVGREVALLFEGGDLRRPILVGLMQSTSAVRPEILADGEPVVVEADRELVLRCGAASITLSRDGKIRIRGTDLLARSSGGNRIKGANVRIN